MAALHLSWFSCLSCALLLGCGDGDTSSTGSGSGTGSGTGTSDGTGGVTDVPTTSGSETGGGTQTGGDATTQEVTSQVDATMTSTGALDPSTTGTSGEIDASSSTGGGPVCGDGLVEAGEMCEPGDAGCQADCTYPSGQVLWTDIVPGITPNGGARGWGAAFSADDVPLATMSRGGPFDAGGGSYIKTYTREGDEVWSERWSDETWPSVTTFTLAVQPDGAPVLVGQVTDKNDNDGFIGQMSVDGAIGWGQQLAHLHNDVLVDAIGLADGSIVGVGFRNQDPMLDDRGWIVKVTATGVEAWQQLVSAPGTASAFTEVATLADGTIVAFGCCGADGESLLRAYEPDGSIAWTTTLPVLADVSLNLGGMTVDRNGDIVVLWQTPDDAPWLGKYSDDGGEVWTKSVDDPALEHVAPKSVAATPQGRYFFAGVANAETLDADIAYGSFDEDGALLWSDTVAGPDKGLDQVESVAVDSHGLVLLAGMIDEGEYKSWVRMMAP